ncbi:hypothetical protein PFISCL1PPCAC_23053, partial [Pristionchus fissidentatus]
APRMLSRVLVRLPSRSIGRPSLRRLAEAPRKDSMEEARFSKSAAFQGRRGRGAGVVGQSIHFDYYMTDEFNNKKLLSAIGSIAALVLYFGWLREPSDLDEIMSTPPHILTSSLERKMLRDQIKQAKEKGESTELLEAQLEYVDVKEAALKVQFKK